MKVQLCLDPIYFNDNTTVPNIERFNQFCADDTTIFASTD